MASPHLLDCFTSLRTQGHLTSSARANQLNNFVYGRQPAGLLLGIDSLTVNENIQRPWPPQADASGNLQFAFDALFQAHGLRLDIASKETTLNFDGHSRLADTTTVLLATSGGRARGFVLDNPG
jgi:hypothetical protein